MSDRSPQTGILDHATESIIDLSARQSRARLTLSALDGFVAIMKAWEIGNEEARSLLGGISSDRYVAMEQDALHEELPEEMMIRISYVIRLVQVLHTVFGNSLDDTWMSRPSSNSIFGGATPLPYCLEYGTVGLKKALRYWCYIYAATISTDMLPYSLKTRS